MDKGNAYKVPFERSHGRSRGRRMCKNVIRLENRMHIISIIILTICHTSLTIMFIYYSCKSAKIITLQTDLSEYRETKYMSLYFVKSLRIEELPE